MKTKKIVKLSEIYQIIGDYLHANGDANVESIATHNNRDPKNHLKYTLHLSPINRELESYEEEKVICIDYNERVIKQTIPSGIKEVDEPLNGRTCVCCGQAVHSTSATRKVCNKCVNEFKF